MRISDWSSDVCSSDLPIGKGYAAMKAPILDRKNSTLDSVEEHLFAQELNRNRRTLADFAPEQHRVPMVSEPQLRVDVRRPRFGTAFGKIRLHSQIGRAHV